MSEFFIRVKTNDHNFKLSDSITSQSLFRDVKQMICNKFGYSNFKVLHGFPPKLINFISNQTLEECGVRRGDTLYIQTQTERNQNDVDCVPDIVNINNVSPDVINANNIPDIMKVNNYGDCPVEDETNSVNSGRHITDNTTAGKGIIMRKEVPSDNSCLFTSVGFLISGKIDSTTPVFMRQLVVEAIRNNPEEFNDAILGKSVNEYCAWILLPTTWGGGIEIAILSDHYGIEIVVANTKTGVLTKFGEDKCYPHRGFLIFDGIHYDPLYMEFLESSNIQTLFPMDNTQVLVEVEQLLNEVKMSKQYVEVREINLICVECGHRMTGCNDASQHMHLTSHTNFDEIADHLLNGDST